MRMVEEQERDGEVSIVNERKRGSCAVIDCRFGLISQI